MSHGSPSVDAERYPIRIDERASLMLRLLWGATPDRAWLTLDDQRVVARLGRWEISTSTANITRWRIEGPWRSITAIGVRRSIRHGDVSFSGTARGGVRLQLREPIRWTIFKAPVLYVGVEDLEGFTAGLVSLGIDGEDARSR